MKYELATLIFRVHRCCRNRCPLVFRLLRPCGPMVCFRSGSMSLLVPTLQLMSWPKISAVSFGRLLSKVCATPLNSLCLFVSTGW